MADKALGGLRLHGFAGALALLALLAGCGSGSEGTPFDRDGSGVPGTGVGVFVEDTAQRRVAGAKVYLIPAEDVDTSPMTGADILDGSAEDRDEPLEDALRRAGASYPQATTSDQGYAVIDPVPPGQYFFFVVPDDEEHLAGGSICRLSVSFTTFVGTTRTILLSSRPPESATYVGSTTCVSCHSSYVAFREHAHRLGFATPGRFATLQDPARYPTYTGGWANFLNSATYTGGTPVYYFNYDASRGFDKFETSLTDPGAPTVLRAWLWRDTTDGNKFKVTLENVANGGDPRSPWTLEVPLSYGGAVYKQRLLVAVPGRKGHYPFMQWQPDGDDDRWDRTRRVYRDYHMDWFWDAGTQTLQDPPTTSTFEGNCTGCHSTGFQRFQDDDTGEWLSTAVNDNGGAFDLDDDGTPNEINVGCEVCHGPGSSHVLWAGEPQNAGVQARYIVTPQNLSPGRRVMLCGRCHDRPKGNSTFVTDEPLNAMGFMPPAGISRHDYIQEFTTRAGPALSNYWSDEVHSKSHRQQASDLLKSPMYRNDRILTVCSDCHDSHGRAPWRNQLDWDPDDADSLLCRNCHIVDLAAHTLEKVGWNHEPIAGISCTICHQYQVTKSGAGEEGLTKGTPTGGPGDEDRIYWVNDIGAHHFVGVPRKTHPDVVGERPSDAMPIPYTNSCGPCHQVNSIPTPPPGGGAPLRAPPEED